MTVSAFNKISQAGRVNRRGLIKGGGALGLAMAAASFSSPAKAATKGGHMKMGCSHGMATDSTEPGTYSHGFAILLSYTIHAKLTIVGTDNVLHGDLAESWDGLDAAKKWVFRLRDAEFHDGSKITAADVIASINHHRGADSTSNAKSVVENIASITADGDNTVVFDLTSGDADFPFILTDYQLAICKANADGTIDWQNDGSRAGPYKLASFEPGVRAVFEKADTYWNPDVGHVASAEVLVITDVTARQNALLTGEVDVIDRPEIRTLDMLSNAPGIRVEEDAGFRYFGFTVFTRTAPYDNNDLRLALKYGIDREAMLNVALSGHGILGNDTPITPAYRYYNAEIPQRSYDPDRAKFHLNKAGLDSLDLELSASSAAYAAAVDCSLLYQSNLAPIGINLNVVNEPADSYWSNVWLKKPFIAIDWGGRPTEDLMFSVAFKADAPWNDTQFDNERFEKLLIEARAELDETKRREMYGEMQLILNEEGGLIAPMLPNNIWAVRSRIRRGEELSRAWELDGWQFISRWWIEE
ncbi:ABC transporter substrate-binding protein [Paracoccus sp. IB05]|uniref:ABC transporter substrate-binding protein n=1 Tax=Paracoccus sp. IB05 TaxID=2779367 RepID=UPI0018E7176B|nr:ABC transporter substrate-binding protein [Paracoccus sp. IB05]